MKKQISQDTKDQNARDRLANKVLKRFRKDSYHNRINWISPTDTEMGLVGITIGWIKNPSDPDGDTIIFLSKDGRAWQDVAPTIRHKTVWKETDTSRLFLKRLALKKKIKRISVTK